MFNINFHEVFSVTSDMNSVLCMVFNSVTDELITGGTGGIKVSLYWSNECLDLCQRFKQRTSKCTQSYS